MGNLIISLAPSNGQAPTFSGTSVADINMGVTYNFASPVTYGYYWNGSPFVLLDSGSHSITSITPESETTTRKINGAELDPYHPTGSGLQGFDGGATASYYIYDDALNVDPGNTGEALEVAFASHPTGAVLVKAVSLAAVNVGKMIQRYSALTFVPEIPTAGAFRPGIAATDKALPLTISDLDYTKLQSVAPVASQRNITTFDYLESGIMPTWWSNADARWWIMPQDLGEGYASRDMKNYVEALQCLHSNYTNEQKATLYAAMVQHGIDHIAAVDRGITWTRNYTKTCSNRFFAAIAAVALDDADLKSTVSLTGNQWPENEQFDYIGASQIGVTGSNVSSAAAPLSGREFLSSDDGLPWGFTPSQATLDRVWMQIYLDSIQFFIPAASLSIEMMGNGEGRTVFNREAWFEYGTRVARVHDADPEVYRPGTVYAPTDAMLEFVAAYEGAHSTSTNTYAPESYDAELSLTFGSTTIEVDLGGAWPAGSAAVTQYDLRYSTDNTTWTEISDVSFPYQITGRANSTLYFISVRARNVHGTGPWSGFQFKVGNFGQADRVVERLVATGLVAQATIDAAGGVASWFQGQAYKDECEKILVPPSAGYETLAAEMLTNVGITTA